MRAQPEVGHTRLQRDKGIGTETVRQLLPTTRRQHASGACDSISDKVARENRCYRAKFWNELDGGFLIADCVCSEIAVVA